MTEAARPKKAMPKRPGPLAVFAVSAGTFCAALALLAGQMRQGDDPVIGARAPAAAPAPASTPAPAAPAPPPLTTRAS